MPSPSSRPCWAVPYPNPLCREASADPRFPKGGLRWHASIRPTRNGRSSPRCFPERTARRTVVRDWMTGKCRTASSSCCGPAYRGAICRNVTAPIRRSTIASTDGPKRGSGSVCSRLWRPDRRGPSHSSTVRSSSASACCRRKKGGQDHAIGRSRGGLSTKINALVDSRGLPVRIVPSPGQASDKAAVPLLFDGRRAGDVVADRG